MRILISLFFLSFSLSAIAQNGYTYKKGDPNGIDKWYMGRQIAHIMSHYGIDWLERPEREKEENSSLLLKNMQIKDGMMIADIGAGSGYHSMKMSSLTPNGKVYAVDVEPEMIAYLEARIKQEKRQNVVTLLGASKSTNLPANSMDIILLVDVYHEFEFPYEMALSMRDALKKDGTLYLIEFRSEDNRVPIKLVHKMSEAQAVKELTAAGFVFEKNISNLPWQHCLVFKKAH
jgi:protein-L-isoaspartate O-methyltransferase